MNTAATLTRAGNHWLATEHGRGGKLAREELFPELEVTGVPRVGTVAVRFACDRYNSSGGWTDWRILIREVTPDKGVGDTGRKIIREACEPIIRAWLESPAYLETRQRSAAQMLARIIREDNQYGTDNARAQLARHGAELTPESLEALTSALDSFDTARELLESATK
jgi:hypothetical protein